MKSTVYSLAAIVAVLTLHVGMVSNEKLGVKLACLDKTPSDQCNLVVTYDPPVGTLQCDQKVAERDGDALAYKPELGVTLDTQENLQADIVVMFDPDAPVSKQATDGFVHLIADATVDQTGRITIGTEYLEYYPPTPPRGGGVHRYQFFLYKLDDGKSLIYTQGRRFDLCSFMKQNNLTQPIAASQFKFERP